MQNDLMKIITSRSSLCRNFLFTKRPSHLTLNQEATFMYVAINFSFVQR